MHEHHARDGGAAGRERGGDRGQVHDRLLQNPICHGRIWHETDDGKSMEGFPQRLNRDSQTRPRHGVCSAALSRFCGSSHRILLPIACSCSPGLMFQ